MDIEVLIQELTEKMEALQTELVNCRRQKDVSMILEYLKSIKNVVLGYNNVMTKHHGALCLSSEGIADFISILDSGEYIKGYSSGSIHRYGENGGRTRDCKYDVYYLTFGPGIVLELSFSIPEIKGSSTPVVENQLDIRTFADTQELGIKIDTSYPNYPKVVIVKSNGDDVFDSNTTDDYLKLNNHQLSEALMPVSIDDLTTRFFSSLQKKEEVQI